MLVAFVVGPRTDQSNRVWCACSAAAVGSSPATSIASTAAAAGGPAASSSPIVAAADAPASPVPTMMTSYFRLFAGFTSFMSKRCLSHFCAIGPEGTRLFSSMTDCPF